MTVPATPRRAGPFTGNGVTTSFPFSFKIFSEDDVRVVRAANGLETTLVVDSDYSVTLNGDQDASPGGSITYPLSGDPLPSGQTLTVTGALENTQELDLPGGGAFNPRALEDALDRIVIQVQQIDEVADRALTLPVSATSGVSTQLPVPAANNVIGWDETGSALVNLNPASLATVVVAGTSYTDVFSGTGAQTAFVLTANPGSVNALDIAISGVSQVNGVDFTVSGTTLTFTSAPPAGTGNIAVRYVAAVPIGSANAQDVVSTAPNGVPRDVQARLDNEFHIADYGGAPGNTEAQNRAALQAMISAMNLAGGGVGNVPYNIDWGYVDTDVTKLPDYTGVTAPICIRDFSRGSSFAGYPDAYDGAQEKRLLFTPQPFATLTFTAGVAMGGTGATLSAAWSRLSGLWEVTFSNGDRRSVNFTNGATTATWVTPLTSAASSSFNFVNYGQHNGNYFIVRGDWPPGFQVFNDANYGAPNATDRTAFDNRRAHFAVGYKGKATWQVGQGVKVGPGWTDEELSDFHIEKLPQSGETLGAHSVLVVERKTCNASYGGGRTIPNAVHHFERGASLNGTLVMLEDTGATLYLTLRVGGSSGGDFSILNQGGNFVIEMPLLGNAMTVRGDTRNVLIGAESDNAAAILNVASTTKGFLPPRMTTAQRDAIASPPAGLMIYNTTTNKLNVRTASSWEAITSA